MLEDLRELIKFCRITLGGSDTGAFPVQQISFMKNTADAFIVFPYGMHANVANDALGVALGVNADDQQLAAIMTSAKERIKGLEQNEVIFFHPKTKSFTHYKNDGSIETRNAKGFSTLKANGDADINGAIIDAATGNVTTKSGTSLDGHKHGSGTIATTATIGGGATVGVISGDTDTPS